MLDEQEKVIIKIYGLPCAGKSTIQNLISKTLDGVGFKVISIDDCDESNRTNRIQGQCIQELLSRKVVIEIESEGLNNE